MSSRAERRFQEQNKKQKIKRIIRHAWDEISRNLADDPKFVGRMAKTPHPCSSFCCGNPRKHFGQKTVQEKKFDDATDAE